MPEQLTVDLDVETLAKLICRGSVCGCGIFNPDPIASCTCWPEVEGEAREAFEALKAHQKARAKPG